MKKMFLILSALTVIASVSACLFLPESSSKHDNTLKANNNQSPAVETVSKPKTENTYLIRKYGEKIGVFRKGAGKPFCIIDTFVFTLPQNDKAMLTNGFTIYETELGSIVEDYTG